MDCPDHLRSLEEYTPVVAAFSIPHPNTALVHIGNTYNIRREYTKSEYPRDRVTAATIGEGLYRWITGNTEQIEQVTPPVPVPPARKKPTHKVLHRDSTFLAYKFNARAEYIEMVNSSLKHHGAACLSLPDFNTPELFVRLASRATFLMIVDINNIILGYYRIGGVTTMTSCREQKIQLTSPMTTSHKYVVYVKRPCITMTNEHISELELVPLMGYLPPAKQAIGSCEMYRFPQTTYHT